MLTMHEALARERLREAHRQADEVRLVRALSAQRRWHRLANYALAAETRQAQRVNRALSR